MTISRPEKTLPDAVPAKASLRALGHVPGSWTTEDSQVKRELGQGGVGEACLARQISLGRLAALQVSCLELMNEPAELARFEAETRNIVRLSQRFLRQALTQGAPVGGGAIRGDGMAVKERFQAIKENPATSTQPPTSWAWMYPSSSQRPGVRPALMSSSTGSVMNDPERSGSPS